MPLPQEELAQRELAQKELAQEELDWVLVCAPFRKDADYVSALLREHLIEVRAVTEAKCFAQFLEASPGIVIVSHEALTPQIVALTAEHLSRQPNWSEVPIIVLLERGAPLIRIRNQLLSAWPGARLLFYTRPVAPLELVSGIQSNLLVRLRQRQVRDSIERERELRAELNHRVKNILATVTSIFRMTRRGAESLDDLATDFNGRLLALSNVHTAVFEAGGEDVSLSAVVDLIVSPYGTERIAVDGSDLLVSREAGTTLALCLHELITNAIKYGALSVPEGRVSLRWAVDRGEKPTFHFHWQESNGPSVRTPARQGYGTRYVTSALASLFAATPDIQFAENGLVCSAAGPFARISPASVSS
ncbi:sensor histidine kinase [Agrobacterium vitis]|uniref:histidine kinase n=1 Tax=Agrobacterium vitis TaxID=373 RepID=A0ABD6GEB5_AGRVI|nr:sensor histidine kinase [Agrobacterium vitis]MUO78625.1 sensor histidine kinase [Agrobacterium vitis]MUO95173.1 sensor histidine kinase [Agrobacterium vitis]MUP05036.1 sensor histidine kinase [Agrobacterium vitis]MUZ81782.1 sensor histidine kinase [Agrobacterium vitis]MVA09514.1 sensor histidine kinase [Agrobacterium vitis]